MLQLGHSHSRQTEKPQPATRVDTRGYFACYEADEQHHYHGSDDYCADYCYCYC